MIGRQSERMSYPKNNFSRRCLDEEEEKLIQNFLCDIYR